MFTRYWRSYPFWLQLALFMLMVFTLISFSYVLLLLIVPKCTGVQINEITALSQGSTRKVINAAMLAQALSSIGTFLIPAFLFAYLATPRPAEYLGLKAPGKPVQWLLVIMVMVGALPLLLECESLLQHLNFGKAALENQQRNNDIMEAFLNMNSPLQFLVAIFVVAILPAAGEEMFFRGLIMKFAAKRSVRIIFPAIFSALLFAFAHSNIYGFLAIFLAGLLLGYIYYLTGSLLCSMLAHFIHNGLQVTILYFSKYNAGLKAMQENNTITAERAPGSYHTVWRIFLAAVAQQDTIAAKLDG